MITGLEGGFDSMIAPSEVEMRVTEGKQFQCDTFKKMLYKTYQTNKIIFAIIGLF